MPNYISIHQTHIIDINVFSLYQNNNSSKVLYYACTKQFTKILNIHFKKKPNIWHGEVIYRGWKLVQSGVLFPVTSLGFGGSFLGQSLNIPILIIFNTTKPTSFATVVGISPIWPGHSRDSNFVSQKLELLPRHRFLVKKAVVSLINRLVAHHQPATKTKIMKFP